MPLAAALELRQRDPTAYEERSLVAIAHHVEAMLRLQKMGAVTFDFGNNIRTFARPQGAKNACEIPGLATYLRPQCRAGRGPLRWVALSGNAADIAVTDDLVLQLFPQDRGLKRWIDVARKRIRFQGLPARIGWLGCGEGAQFGLAINDLVKQGRIKAPIVIGCDHLDSGSADSPVPDGSDAIADWPLLNALLNTASGATWISIHHRAGTGVGYAQHAGQVTVADGTDEMARRIERVLTNDSGIGIARHVEAGDAEARDLARRAGIKIPMPQN
jgi:urocanate hydratase